MTFTAQFRISRLAILFGLSGGAALSLGCSSSSDDTGGSSGGSVSATTGGTTSAGGASAGGASAGGATSAGGASSTGGASAGGASSGGAATGGTGACAAPAGSVTTPTLSVKNWNGHTGAVSFGIDDAYSSALDAVVPAMNARNIPATFFVICNNVKGREADWKAVIDAGVHEVTNHTMSHAAADGTNSAEIEDCDAYLKTIGAVSHSFAYPLSNVGEPYKSYTAEHYIAGRGGSGQSPLLVHMADNPDWTNISSDYTGDGQYGTLAKDSIIAGIDAAVSQDSWYNVTTHSILPENNFAGIPQADYEAELDHAVESGVWVGTFSQVAAYLRAQKTLTAATPTTDAGGTKWTWTAAPGTPDGTTLQVVVDGGKLSQGGAPLEWNCDGGYYPVDVMTGELTWSM